MERKIMFRGKRFDNEDWIYGKLLADNIISDHKTGYVVCPRDLSTTESELVCYGCRVIPETVGQFTGLHDKNGKEIYEGDIIRHHDFSNVYKPDFDGEVVFSKSSFRIKFKSEYDKSGFLYWGLCFDDFANGKIEVIGNIHDNPELLKPNENE